MKPKQPKQEKNGIEEEIEKIRMGLLLELPEVLVNEVIKIIKNIAETAKEEERKRCTKIIDLHEKYEKLLAEELDELVGIASVHGWRSSRAEKGVKLRNQIKDLINNP